MRWIPTENLMAEPSYIRLLCTAGQISWNFSLQAVRDDGGDVVSLGADVNVYDVKGKTPYMIAAANGHITTTKTLSGGGMLRIHTHHTRTHTWFNLLSNHFHETHTIIDIFLFLFTSSHARHINFIDDDTQTIHDLLNSRQKVSIC